MEKPKTYMRLLEAVNHTVEVEFGDGSVLYGRLDSFDYDRMLITVRVSGSQPNIHLINLRWVKTIRYKEK